MIQQLERHIGIDIGGVIVGRLGLGFGGLGVVLGVVDSGRLAGGWDANCLDALDRLNRKGRLATGRLHVVHVQQTDCNGARGDRDQGQVGKGIAGKVIVRTGRIGDSRCEHIQQKGIGAIQAGRTGLGQGQVVARAGDFERGGVNGSLRYGEAGQGRILEATLDGDAKNGNIAVGAIVQPRSGIHKGERQAGKVTIGCIEA